MTPFIAMGALALGVLSIAALAWLIRSWRIRQPESRGVAVEAFPPRELERQKHLGSRLEEGGFVFAGMQVERRGDRQKVWQSLFRNHSGSVWAVVESELDEKPRLVFHTFFTRDQTVTTCAGGFLDLHFTDDWWLTEHPWESLRAQAEHHQQRVLGIGGKVMAVRRAEDFRSCYQRAVRREVGALQEVGFLVADPKARGVYRVAGWRAPGVALRMLSHARRYRPGGDETGAGAEAKGVAAEDSRDDSLEGWMRHYAAEQKRTTALSRFGWSPAGAAVCVVLFLVLAGGLVTGTLSGSDAVLIFAVLALHDLGHVLVMRLLRFRDFGVLWLPFLGLLAPRSRVRVPPWQEGVMLLAGPLPGLLVGWGLLAGSCFLPGLPSLLVSFGFWAALINNLNFLTVLPFDGGRLVNRFLFERVPALRVPYLLGAALVVGTGAVLALTTFGAPPLAAIGAVLLVGVGAGFGFPENRRLACLTPWARLNLSPADDDTEAMLKAFQIVEQAKGARRRGQPGWSAGVDAVLRLGCSRPLGAGASVAVLLAVLLFLHSPIWVLGAVAMAEAGRVRSEHRVLAERIEELAPEVSWRGSVVSERTRADLEVLRAGFEETLAVLYNEQLALAVGQFEYDSRGIFDPSEAITRVRGLRWDEVSTWIAEEDTNSRQQTARVLVEALIGSGREAMAGGRDDAALIDFSKACWAISTCEPKTSFGEWVDWLYLEKALVDELEVLVGRRGIPEEYARWFAATLRARPGFESKKMALLLLYDLQGDRQGRLSSATALGDRPRRFPELLSGLGYSLRRTEADRDLRGGEVSAPRSLGFEELMETLRVVQGLPTRDEFRAGLQVAQIWAAGGEVSRAQFLQVEDPVQRSLWTGRFDRLERMLYHRQLAVTALETELPSLGDGPRAGIPPAAWSGLRVQLTRDSAGRYALTSRAPDGTKLRFRLSPEFRP